MKKQLQKRPSRPNQIKTLSPSREGVKVFDERAMPAGRSLGFPKWSALYSCVFLAFATILCLVPFSGRAFHVDDTLFVRAAQQIAQHPFDPYGFDVNWDAAQQPMSEVTENPPLAAYYIAVMARVVGWSERALHLAFIPVALALVLGTYCLARKFTRSPLLASFCTLLTPGVLVCASSVMCDTMMLALWVWAAYFWIEGLDSESKWLLTASGLLIAAAALTKYFGVSLIPLLLVYTVMRFRRIRPQLLYLLIPVAAVFAYESWTASLYGHGLLQGALEYAQSQHNAKRGSVLGMGVLGLSYAGGCSLLGWSFARLVWSRKQVITALIVGLVATLAVAGRWLNIGWVDIVHNLGEGEQQRLRWFAGVQLILCITGGMLILWLAIMDFRESKTADSVFLGLWVLGTFFFAAFVNWTVNGRSVLPLIPAAAILVSRRLDDRAVFATRGLAIQVIGILLASAFLSLWVTAADSELANSERTAATLVYEKTHDKGGAAWFVGHWGFQYYLESRGLAALDLDHPQADSGDFVIIAGNNSHFAKILPAFIASRENVEVPLKAWATTISSDLGAGFYSSYGGPLPYVIGPVPAESYSIIRLGTLPGQNRPR